MTDGGKSPLQMLVQDRTGTPDLEALLRELYVDRRWTHQEIAAHLTRDARVAVSRTTVVGWCQDFGIERSDRTATVEPPAEATA